MQVQRRASLSADVLREGFVLISRERMAESRSERVEEAPRMDVPPERLILVVDDCLLREAGEEERLVSRESEMRGPVAEGGIFELLFEGVELLLEGCAAWGGAERKSGFDCRARVLARGGSLPGLCRLLPAI